MADEAGVNTDTTALTDPEADLLDFIEQDYLLRGTVPSEEFCVEKGICSGSFYRRVLKKQNFRHALVMRGITLRGLDGPAEGRLTEQQLVVANTLLDNIDNRSRKKKLADLGVSSTVYEGWLRDPVYSSYIRGRAENKLQDAIADGHTALAERARSGDISAIKYLNEITGRYNPNATDKVDVNSIVMLVVEVIQRHVTDPNTLRLLSDDILLILGGAQAASTQQAAVPSMPGSPRALPGKVIDL